jgi:pilus assembly protein Flp/PilA
MVEYLRILINARVAKLEDRGASAVEYGLLVAGIAALIVAVVFAFGGLIKNIFKGTCNAIATSTSVASGSSCS